ncbi:MAG: PASTA domain-containing protein [Candidatus Sulfotelmatobacter sp.]|jgi:hypothetical protein
MPNQIDPAQPSIQPPVPNVSGQVQPPAQSGPPNVAGPTQPPAQPGTPNVGGPGQPPAKVTVPDVVGLTRSAAQDNLRSAGLVLGAVRTHDSNSVPTGGVSDTNPDAGTLVDVGSQIQLDISSGPKLSLTQYIPTGLFTLLGLTILGLIVYAITQSDQAFLSSLADKERARGLITFLIAITVVGVAIILSISTLILASGDEGDKRFDRGKQVLSVLIGVLGTIVGFYFGAETKPKEVAPTEQTQSSAHIVTSKLPDGVANQPYPQTTLQTAGLVAPWKWTVKPTLPAELAFDEAHGTISGTPKAPAPKTQFAFTVTDSSTPPITETKKLDLEIK